MSAPLCPWLASCLIVLVFCIFRGDRRGIVRYVTQMQSRKTGYAWKPVKPRIKGEYPLDSVFFHDGEMHCVTRRQFSMAEDNLLCPLRSPQINREHLVDNSQDGIESRLDRVATINDYVAMQDLLKDFHIRDETLAFTDQLFQQPLCICFVRMRRADEVHGNIRVHEDHGCIPAP